MRNVLRVLTATAAAATLAACGTTEPTGTATPGPEIGVVVGFYPLQFAAERVGGPSVKVTNLAAPGAEPHDLELTPQQVAAVADADLVLYFHGFQPALDEAVEQQADNRSLDVAQGQQLLESLDVETQEPGGEDPHVWLDPTRLATLADAVASKLATVDSAGAAGYRERAATLRRDLEALDGEYQQRLQSCERRTIVVSHAAFGYLAERYQLQQVAISGLTPEEEPGPRRLAEVAEKARTHRVKTIFFETLVSPAVAESLAREIGAKAEVLDPLEGLAADASGDYFTVMRENLTRLESALGCS